MVLPIAIGRRPSGVTDCPRVEKSNRWIERGVQKGGSRVGPVVKQDDQSRVRPGTLGFGYRGVRG